MRIDTLTIVGVGLIGGSIGLAARRRGVAQHVIGVGRNRDNLERARQLGAIDEWSLDLLAAARRSDFLVCCTPVDQIAAQALAAANVCPAGAVLTDAGSTKAALVREVEAALPSSVSFVGSHPLAGSEKRGAEHADARLFEGRLTVVTPTVRSDPAAVKRVAWFWRVLGSRVCFLGTEEHDRALALTSHLPHLVASALAGLLVPELFDLAATGFRDTTRVAAGDPSLWTAIFAHNRGAVLDALAKLSGRLEEFRAALEAGDSAALDTLLTQGKRTRDALGS
ncbi:MAG: prephenate dehydrogenase/arogenate dehydrogenase family protein [Gemmataceae bacterium]|nr:prephenate dehydrogenase/arogenate dehydrogenase family protein [Gemmataceae bacterium]